MSAQRALTIVAFQYLRIPAVDSFAVSYHVMLISHMSVGLLQHFLLGVKFAMSHVIPDVPQWVQDEMARQQYKAQLALRVRLMNKVLLGSNNFSPFVIAYRLRMQG